MHLPANNGGDFEPPPEGTHVCVCYRVIDLGTQQTDYQGQTRRQRKIMLSWELTDEKMANGQPFSIHQRYTLSSHEKATLRQHLEAWRGKRFTDDEFGPNGSFDIKNVLGVGCLINILHEKKADGRVYANIGSIAKLAKGMSTPDLVNDRLYLNLDQFEPIVFAQLSQGLQAVIMKSPEYHDAMNGKPRERVNDEPPPSEDAYGVEEPAF